MNSNKIGRRSRRRETEMGGMRRKKIKRRVEEVLEERYFNLFKRENSLKVMRNMHTTYLLS